MSFLDTVKTDVEAWVASEEAALTADLTAAENVLKNLWASASPTVLNDAAVLFQQVIGILIAAGVDIVTGVGPGKVVTAVLNLAAATGKIAVTQLAPATLNAVHQLTLIGQQAETPVPVPVSPPAT